MKTDMFDSIDDVKKRKLMEAALNEFSTRGYAASTTRDISKSAGVSNGLLFHYFKDKNTLFFELARHCREHIVKTFLSELNEDLNYFNALKQICKVKLRLSVEYPEAYRMLMEEIALFPEKFKQEGIYLKVELERKLHSIEMHDNTIFKHGIDSALVKEIATTALEGMSAKIISEYSSGKLLMEDALKIGFQKADDYLDFFCESFTSDG